MLKPWSNPAIWHAINVHLPITLAIVGLPVLCVVAITRGKHRWMRWSTVALYAVATVAAWSRDPVSSTALPSASQMGESEPANGTRLSSSSSSSSRPADPSRSMNEIASPPGA